MNELWDEQNANLRTMFEFTRETSKFSNNKAYSKDDFIASYPFVNYEFELFQNVLREMSRYNMFSGRHAPWVNGPCFPPSAARCGPARMRRSGP